MKRILWLGSGLLVLSVPALHAQTAAGPATPTPAPIADSGMDGTLFYQLLLGELNTQAGDPGAGFSLVLDAARRTGREQLFQRAVEIGLQSRSGDAALQAARAWKQAIPASREANRFVLQILVALNRVADSAEPLRQEISSAPADALTATLNAIPRTYARVSDKKLAATVVEQALKDPLANPASSATAWTTVGRMRALAGDEAGAIQAAQRALAADPVHEGAALLALELMDAKRPAAEGLVSAYLGRKKDTDMRIGYARALLDSQRYAEASQQLQLAIQEQPSKPDAWLILGVLQLQDNQTDVAEKSLQRYLVLAESLPAAERSRGNAQAYLGLAQIAEKRKNFTAAEAWLKKIDNAQDIIGAQFRRASILARQGKLAEGRALIRALPERNPAEARQKLMSEVQLLRDNNQHQAAFELLGKAVAASPNDADLLYDQALTAEKIGALDTMERLLRQVMALKPESHHAYNALGYSLAERNTRLAEAKQLIQKALEFAPGDPFISDSLGWVEFRLGNKEAALRVLEQAYKTKPDAEIAAHLGEVLWSLGQKERAVRIWKEGLLLNADNDTLREALRRLQVKL